MQLLGTKVLFACCFPLHLSGICQMFKQYDFDGRLILVLTAQAQLSDAKSKLQYT